MLDSLRTLPAALAPGEVHVWQIPCDMEPATEEQLRTGLSAADQARAARFLVDPPRRQFIVGHALLRRLIARYLGGHKFLVGRGANGKPYLAAPQWDPPLEFNISHSQNLVLLAFCSGGAVGIDVEAVAPLADLDDLAAAYFSPGERAELAQTEGAARLRRFYHFWTRKEAWLKLVGSGINRELNQVDMRVSPAGVTLLELPVPSGHVAALAVAGTPTAVHCQVLPAADAILTHFP